MAVAAPLPMGPAVNIPEVNIKGMTYRAEEPTQGPAPVFSTRIDRYGLETVLYKHWPCSEARSPADEVAFQFGAKLRTDFPVEAARVDDNNYKNLLLWFDSFDITSFGAEFLYSVLYKLAWSNSCYEKNLGTFAQNWFAANASGYDLFMACGVIPWSQQDVLTLGRNFLDDVLAFCLRCRPMWLQTGGALSSSLALLHLLSVAAKPAKANTKVLEKSSTELASKALAETAAKSPEAADAAGSAHVNGYTEDGPVICHTTTPSPPLEYSLPVNSVLPVEPSTHPAKIVGPRRTSSCPPLSDSDDEGAQALKDAVAGVRKEMSTRGLDDTVDWASLAEADEEAATQVGSSAQEHSFDIESITEAPGDHPVVIQSADMHSTDAANSSVTAMSAPDAPVATAPKSEQISLPAPVEGGEKPTTSDAEANRRRSFDEVARNFLAVSKASAEQELAEGMSMDIHQQEQLQHGGQSAGKLKPSTFKSGRSSTDSSIINDDPSIIAVGIGGEHRTSPDLAVKPICKANASNDSLSSLISQDPSIMAAGFHGQSRLSPEFGGAVTMPPANSQDLQNLENFPVSPPTSETELLAQAVPTATSPPAYAFNQPSYHDGFSYHNTNFGGPQQPAAHVIHPGSPPQRFLNPAPVTHHPPLILNPEVPAFVGAAPMPQDMPLQGASYQQPGFFGPDARFIVPYSGNAFQPFPQNNQQAFGSSNPHKLYTDDARMLEGPAPPKRGSFYNNRPPFNRELSYAQSQAPGFRDVSGNSAYYSASSRRPSNISAAPSMSTVVGLSQGSPMAQPMTVGPINPPEPQRFPSGFAPGNMQGATPFATHTMLDPHAPPFVAQRPHDMATTPTYYHQNPQGADDYSSAPSGSLYRPKRGKPHYGGGYPRGSYRGHQYPQQQYGDDNNVSGHYRRQFPEWSPRQKNLKKLHVSCSSSLSDQAVSTMFMPYKPFNVGPTIKNSKVKGSLSSYCFVE